MIIDEQIIPLRLSAPPMETGEEGFNLQNYNLLNYHRLTLSEFKKSTGVIKTIK